jgi:mono/diheme cytochrome c family protein
MAAAVRILNLASVLWCAGFVCISVAAAGDESRSGEQVYQSFCVKCHGAVGEGVKDKHADPLIGDKSVLELARLIEKTMPEDDPGKCVGDDAQKVAAYIYDTFYSPAARMRNKPARVELARLTVRQYQNAVTDLIGGFRSEGKWGDERGLKGEYFKSRNFRDGDKAFERIDPRVSFDFGDAGPQEEGHESDKFDPRQFSIRWQGSLLAPETGDYEVIVKTEHAVRLSINDLRQPQPLIDAWVKSGNDTEYHASLRLLGGRVYPIRLEFSKAKQGVDDSDKQKNKPPAVKASIVLEWKLPHQVAETIPVRCLSPQRAPEVFVLQTPFPPDDRSVGYERGTSISKAWDQATTDAAIETADYVTSRIAELSGVKESATDRSDKLRKFCYRFAERAFRRPLTDEQRAGYVDHQFEQASDPEAAIKRVVLLVLKSPRFLYREIGDDAKHQQFDVAARLSFGLWDSLPDKELLRAAAAGELTTREQVAKQADRMLPDLRTHAKLHEFFWQWLKVDESPDISKDAKQYPGFTPEIATDLRTSMAIFIGDILWSDASDFRQLFLADALPMNGRLAKYYGADLPADAPFQDVPLDPDHRSGVLTHPYLLAAFAHASDTSPIRRGVFISRNLLGRALKPPPEAFTPLSAELHADLTTRERTALQTQSQACMVCHSTINPLGFTLEQFDAAGRFRTEDNGKPVDASGAYETRSGEVQQFKSVCDLAKFLADSDETHAAFVEQLFHCLIKQPVRAYGSTRLDELNASFKQNEFNVRKLASEIVTGAAIGPQGKN